MCPGVVIGSRVELLPRFKGIATMDAGKLICRGSLLNFCPASRGLRLSNAVTRFSNCLVELLPRFKGIATLLCLFFIFRLEVELLPRFKGIATRRSVLLLLTFMSLNFCPASRGLRRSTLKQSLSCFSVELLPRFKGFATSISLLLKDPRLVELLPRFKGIATRRGSFRYGTSNS